MYTDNKEEIEEIIEIYKNESYFYLIFYNWNKRFNPFYIN